MSKHNKDILHNDLADQYGVTVENEKVSILVKNIWSCCDFFRAGNDKFGFLLFVLSVLIYKRLCDLNKSGIKLNSIKNIDMCDWCYENTDGLEIINKIENMLIQVERNNINFNGVFYSLFTSRNLTKNFIRAQKSICHLIGNIDFTLNEFSPKLFDNLIIELLIKFKPSSKEARHYLIDNNGFTSFLALLLSPSQTDRVLIPYTGVGDIYFSIWSSISKDGNTALNSLSIDAFEEGQAEWAIAKIRIALLDIFETSLLNKSVDKLYSSGSGYNGQYDIIASLPPFGLTVHNFDEQYLCLGKEHIRISKTRSELYSLLRCINHMSSKGKLVIILPKSFLIDSTCKNIRKYLVDNDMIDMIVDLPAGFMLGNTISSIAIILDKNKNTDICGKICYFKYDIAKSGRRNFDKLEIKYHIDNDISDEFGFVSIQSIKKNNYSLAYSSYIGTLKNIVNNAISNLNAKPIRDLTYKQIIKGQVSQTINLTSAGYPIISIRDLSKSVTDPYIDFTNIRYGSLRPGNWILNEKAILIALVGGNPKVTIFDPEQVTLIDEYGLLESFNGALVSQAIAVIFPDSSKIDLEYLYYQLHEDLFRRQYDALIKQSTYAPRLAIEDLRNIVVPVMPLADQSIYTDQHKSSLLERENARVEALRERLKIPTVKHEAQFDLIHHLAHDINPKLNGIGTPIRLLKKFLSEKQLSTTPILPDIDSDLTVEKLLSSAEHNIAFIADILNNAQRFIGKKIAPESFTIEKLCDYFKTEIASFSNNVRDMNIRVKCGDEIYCTISRHFFKTVIENLLENASRYGAKKVTFDITENRESVFIDYTNDGKPFPKDFTKKDFLTYGKKTKDSQGSGQGGAWIGKIIDAHNGEFDIVRDEHPVHFKITLPKRGEV